ncbi:hypothetical protein ACM66B_001381 [Microbotryomycetes sp. NB124-2]
MASSTQSPDAELRALATKAPSSITESDVDRLLTNCLPSQTTAPFALAVFARWLEPAHADASIKLLRPALSSYLASSEPAPAFATLSAILQVSPKLGVELVKQDSSVRTLLEQAVERATSVKGKEKLSETHLALADLLSHCAGQSALRATVRQTAGTWLEAQLGSQTATAPLPTDLRLACTAGVAVSKLKIGTEPPEQASSPSPPATAWSIEQLVTFFTRAFLASKVDVEQASSPETDAAQSLQGLSLEALAYLTLAPSLKVKPMLIKPAFLKAFLRLKLGSRALDYAAATLLEHLTAYPPPSDTDHLKARLRSKASGETQAPQEPSETVSERNKLIASFGPMALVKQLCASPSLAVRRLTAKIILALVTPQQARGRLIQAGAARCCLALLRAIPTTPFEPSNDSSAIQALAKLLITTNPMLVIGPTPDSPLVKETVERLLMPLTMVQNDEELGRLGLLIKFECLMALTNVTSFNSALIETSSTSTTTSENQTRQSIVTVLQDLMLNDHVMIRRAATELVCNVCTSPSFVKFYTPPPPPLSRFSDDLLDDDDKDKTKLSNGLSLLVALTNSQDLSTSLAASATLSQLVEQSQTIGLSLLTSCGSTSSNVSTETSKGPFEKLLEIGTDEKSDVGLRHRCLDVVNTIVKTVTESERQERVQDGTERSHVKWFEKGRRQLHELRVKEKLQNWIEQERDQQVVDLCTEALANLDLASR